MDTMKKTFLLNHWLVTPYHPRGNVVAENHVKSACNMIRKLIKGKQSDWNKHIPFIQLSMNTRVVSLHNSTPFSLFFARKANAFSNYTSAEGKTLTQEELLDRLKYMTKIVFPAIEEKTKRAQAKIIECFNASVLLHDFPEGAKVMTIDPIKGNKLSPQYEGPYTVEKGTSHGSYILHDGTGAQLSRHYAPSQLKLVFDDFEDTITYEVEEIKGHREPKDAPGTYEYEVKWARYPETTWEPQENFIEQQCIINYWAKKKTESYEEVPKDSILMFSAIPIRINHENHNLKQQFSQNQCKKNIKSGVQPLFTMRLGLNTLSAVFEQ
jgi:hypothetical protein